MTERRNNSGGLVESITEASRFMARRQRWRTILVSATAVAGPVFLLAVLDYFWPFAERSAFYGLLVVIGLAAIYVTGRIAAYRRNLPSRRSVALLLEEQRPDLMDSVICALELQDAPPARRNPIAESLLASVDTRLSKIDIRSVVRANTTQLTRLVALAVFLGALIAAIGVLPLPRKAISHGRDVLQGQISGMAIRPGSIEVAKGDDLSIEVEVFRGDDAARLTIFDSKGRTDYEMYTVMEGTRGFDIYGIDDDFTYTITTPILRSERFQVTTYDKPVVTACTITITPPSYTSLPSRTVDELSDISVPQGSAVRFDIESNVPVAASMVIDAGSEQVFNSVDGGRYQFGVVAHRSQDYYIRLTDAHGHAAKTQRYRIESIIDFAPVIQILRPDENAVIKSDESASFTYRIQDDYGVQSVVMSYSINGEAAEELLLFEEDTGTHNVERIVATQLDLNEQIKDGDVISYVCTAVDNAVPTGNRTTTEVRFIEVRPDKPDLEPEEGAGQGKAKKLSVSDLIVEQKHLIKLTWKVSGQPGMADAEDIIRDLASAATELHQVTKERVRGLIGQDLPPEPEPASDQLVSELFKEAVDNATHRNERAKSLGVFGELFGDAIGNMASAESLLQKRLPEESIPFQQRSLSNLINIEIELEKNPPPSAGKGEEGEASESKDVQEANEAKKSVEKSEFLQAAVQRLERLIAEQESLNDDLADESEIRDDRMKSHLQKRQDEVRFPTIEIRDDLIALPDAAASSRELSTAIRHMERVVSKIGQSQFQNAEKESDRSLQFLKRGKELLEKLLQDSQSGGLRQAKSKLDALRKRQNELAAATEQRGQPGAPADDAKDKGLLAAQKGLRTSLDELLAKIASMADDMEGSNPDVSEELMKSVETAESGNAVGKMKRSENAIRYDRFEKAVGYQHQAADTLAEMSEHLANAISKSPNVSSEQLSQMLQSVADTLKAMQKGAEKGQSGAGKTGQIQSANQQLQEISEQLNDPLMDAISRSAEQLMAGDSGSSQIVEREFVRLLYRTAQLLESKMKQNLVHERIHLSQQAGETAPDEYRKLVNEYFKNISTRF